MSDPTVRCGVCTQVRGDEPHDDDCPYAEIERLREERDRYVDELRSYEGPRYGMQEALLLNGRYCPACTADLVSRRASDE